MKMKERMLVALFGALIVAPSGDGTMFAIGNPDIWTVLTVDPKGDTRGGLAPDAAQLAFRYDPAADMLWFRVAMYGTPDPSAFGLQIAIDTDRDGAGKAPWWGGNKEFKFTRLLTAQATRDGGTYRGTIGVADADGAIAGNLTSVSHDTLQLRVDADAFIVGVNRADITSGTRINLIASIGTDREWTDEIPNARSVALDLAAPRPARGLREIDVTRDNLVLPAGYRHLTDGDPPSITRRGASTGKTIILVPGVFSGPAAFDPFIARHKGEYRFLIVTPPGLNGTRARRMPPRTASYGDRPWSKRLERDILDLIHRERLDHPILVSHGFPGSLAATAIAADHPDAVGGVIEIAAMPVRPMPSPRDPSGRTPALPAERVRYQDEFWGPKWFKYVTPETWESNNYPAPMFATDPHRGEHVRRQIEATPLPVKIRYLVELNATDDSADIARIDVPLLALRPAFTSAILADPANASLRTSFVDAWNAFSGNARIQLATVPNACVLVFDDQPKAADDAIVAFLEGIGLPR
jgi:pimeloyl-ACP methyl ester carboxylesterase